MDFGRLDTSELYLVDFAFQNDNSYEILPGVPADMKYYVGLAQKGKMKWQDYAAHFPAIEFNGGIYGLPSEKVISNIIKHTPEHFKLAIKLPQTITHLKRLKDVEHETENALEHLKRLDQRFGTLLLNPHPLSSPKDLDRISNFLKLIDVPIAVEVRHQDWFKDGYSKDLLDVLKGINAMTVITDTPGRRDAVHMQLTGPSVFIRFVSCSDPVIDQRRLHTWKLKLEDWQSKGLQECYFMLHADLDAYALAMAEGIASSLGVGKQHGGQIGLF